MNNNHEYMELMWWLEHYQAYGFYQAHFNGVAYWLNELGGLAGVW